jgi:hypothetical protein
MNDFLFAGITRIQPGFNRQRDVHDADVVGKKLGAIRVDIPTEYRQGIGEGLIGQILDE